MSDFDDYCDYLDDLEKEETNMTIDFTKPVYSWDRKDCSTFSNSLEETITLAAKRANGRDSDGTYAVLQVIKYVSTPRPEAIITDAPVA